MTAEQLLTADLPHGRCAPQRGVRDGRGHPVELRARRAALRGARAGTSTPRSSAASPETRDLFPVNMEVQRSRLLRALVHVVQMVDQPDELVPFLEQLGRDHRKFGVLAEHYDAVGVRPCSAPSATFAGDAWTPEVREGLDRALRHRSPTAMRRARPRPSAARPRGWAGSSSTERVGWDLAMITVQTSEPIPYRAGQYVSVETPQRPRLWRYLSPGQRAARRRHLEFHVRAVDRGWVSRAIVAPTRGRATPGGSARRWAGCRSTPRSERDLLMVAGGTGMAPIKALLRGPRPEREAAPHAGVPSAAAPGTTSTTSTRLRKLSYSNPWLDVVPVVENDDDGTSGAERGTLADVVTRYGAWADHDVLVCGSPAMIRATVSRMLVAGTPLDRIALRPVHDGLPPRGARSLRTRLRPPHHQRLAAVDRHEIAPVGRVHARRAACSAARARRRAPRPSRRAGPSARRPAVPAR